MNRLVSAPGRSVSVPRPSVVTDQRRSQRTRTVRPPCDPSATSPFTTTIQSPDVPKRGPPPPMRATLRLDHVQEVIGEAAVCRKCRRKCLTFGTSSVGIASVPEMHCRKCETESKTTNLATAELSEKKSEHKRLVDFAANALFVLGFVTVGDGGREAQRLLGLLDLPNVTTMERTSFAKTEKETAPLVTAIAEEAMFRNLVEEVSLSEDVPSQFNLQEWREAVESGDEGHQSFPQVRASTDMGWQQRKPSLDSLSGHAFLFGCRTRKPMWWCVKAKYCRVCSKCENEGDVPAHDNCPANHVGSSKSMEPLAVVDVAQHMHKRFKCELKYLIADDDSTMKANCRWSNEDYKKHCGDYPRITDKDGKKKMRKQTGSLEYPVHQPFFLGDPNHRTKCVSKVMKALTRKKVKQTAGCQETDQLRITKNFAHFIRELHTLPIDEWVSASRSVTDHHFDLHENCGPFCQRKLESDEDRKKSNKFHRSREKDSELHDALWLSLGDCLTLDRLKEVAHDYNTNCNESLNGIIAWMAPKNKFFSGSASLKSRVAVAVCVQTLGFESFLRTLLGRVKVDITDGTAHWLRQSHPCAHERQSFQSNERNLLRAGGYQGTS